jgi:hypothetical protein
MKLRQRSTKRNTPVTRIRQQPPFAVTVLMRRFHLTARRAALIAELHFGAADAS